MTLFGIPVDSRSNPVIPIGQLPGEHTAQVYALPLPVTPEQELVAGLCERRPASARALYDQYSSLVRQVVIRTLGTAHDVDDLVQETLITVIERKGLGRIQNRYGPNRVGIPFTKIRLAGFGQFAADGIKALIKEDVVPRPADKVVHYLAPIVILIPVLLTYAVLPFGRNMVLADYAAYVAGQEAVDRAWKDSELWTKMSILNVARSGKFSSDRSIRQYSQEIWNVEPMQVDDDEPEAGE